MSNVQHRQQNQPRPASKKQDLLEASMRKSVWIFLYLIGLAASVAGMIISASTIADDLYNAYAWTWLAVSTLMFALMGTCAAVVAVEYQDLIVQRRNLDR